jgi:hypothetical protein
MFTLNGLLRFIIAAIVLVIMVFVVKIVLGMFVLPPAVATLVWLALLVIVLIAILNYFGGGGFIRPGP